MFFMVEELTEITSGIKKLNIIHEKYHNYNIVITSVEVNLCFSKLILSMK